MMLSLVMSIALVFLIMGALFESFILPISILTTIPMAIFGAYWSLYLTGTSFDNIAAIGLIVLIGVVVNNGIVLIELVTRLRNEGMDRITAMIEAGNRRLRPILMTAMTTIVGLLPMAYGAGANTSGISYTPMGRVVAGGLFAGTLLTLFFVPLLYLLIDDLRTAFAGWVGLGTWKQTLDQPFNCRGVFMITVLLSLGLAHAEELSLNYQEALDLALDQNPQIQDAKWSIDGAEAAVMSAKALFDPTLNFSAGQNRNTRQQFFAGIGAFNPKPMDQQ